MPKIWGGPGVKLMVPTPRPPAALIRGAGYKISTYGAHKSVPGSTGMAVMFHTKNTDTLWKEGGRQTPR